MDARFRSILVASSLSVAIGLTAAAPASAALTCDFDDASDILTVNLNANDDFADVDVNAGNIRVLDQAANPTVVVTCTGPQATATNTDTVFMIDNSDLPGGPSLDGNTTMQITGPTDFQPGNDAEASHPQNIEFFVNPNNGADDEFLLFGTQGADNWEIGTDGVNWNAGNDQANPDDELVLSNPTLFDQLAVQASGGEDFVSALGGIATGAPLAGSPSLSLGGGPENDVLAGGNGGDSLSGEAGNDVMQGFPGNDILRGFTGNDIYGGGNGIDTAGFTSSPAGVNVDLNLTGTQDTGEGTDTLTSVEGLLGSNRGDKLIGNAGPNVIQGGNGDDTLDGRGGDDPLDGGEPGFDTGIDTVTYVEAPSGVSANLSLGTASGGAGNDTLTGLENLTGSPFADTLIGSAVANSITGLGGGDTVSALGGADAVDVRDGEADTASCGSEIDTATADKASVDSVNADCETISFLPEDDTGGGDSGGGAADTVLSFDLSGKAKQKVVKQKGVIVTASCPLEACTAVASGAGKLPKPKRAALARLKLKPVTEAVAAGVKEKIKLKLKRKQLDALKAALAAGRKSKVTVTANATDAAGNAVAETLKVTAKR